MDLVRDEELKRAVNYSEGQKNAAYMILGEIVNLLNEFADNMRIIGGWVPTLLYPESDHIGSIDVDVLLNQLEIKRAESYKTIKRLLMQNGYTRHREKYFTFVKTVVVQGIAYEVDVDFLSGKYGGDGGNVSKHVDGIKTLPATGGNFAFEFPPTDVKIEYTRPDGAMDSGHVNVISIVPYLVAPYAKKELVQNMKEKLQEKFASVSHAGPADIVSFLGITDEEEIDRIKQDAYQKINYLVKKIE